MAACRRLVGKVVVVTGSTAGIGFAIAKRVAEEGANVIISSRQSENVNKAVKVLSADGLQVSGIVCNVSKQKDTDNLIEHVRSTYGKCDILVSNVGTNPYYGPTTMCSEEVWNKLFYNNVTCSAILASKALPLFSGSSDGNIIFVSSVSGFCPMPFIGPYSVTKSALMSLTKTLASELASSKIRVNCIAPGIIETDFSAAITANEDYLKKTLKAVPMRRVGTADECAGAVAFLVSSDGSYITGETISINGGIPVRF